MSVDKEIIAKNTVFHKKAHNCDWGILSCAIAWNSTIGVGF